MAIMPFKDIQGHQPVETWKAWMQHPVSVSQ